MEYLINGEEMREIDRYTIEEIGISAMVLMERAALETAACVRDLLAQQGGAVLCICGMGNNGGDGIAVARLLALAGIECSYYLQGTVETASKELKKQIEIADKLNLKRLKECPAPEVLRQRYTVLVDALFGTGLNRDITGTAAEVIYRMNQSGVSIVAVDIPSGVDAGSGQILNCAVRAAKTVTFGMKKLGLCLYPGADYAGQVIVEDIGYPEQAVIHTCKPETFRSLKYHDLKSFLPKRHNDSNKGSYGRVLIVAGSEQVTGAAVLAAEGAYRAGSGLVKVLTSEEGIRVVRTKLPEALTARQECSGQELTDALHWATSVVAGPGIGTGQEAEKLLSTILSAGKEVSLVLDADALNLLARQLDQMEDKKEGTSVFRTKLRIELLSELLPEGTILTPHIKELSRLLGCSVEEISGHLIDIAAQCTYNNKLVFVLKDARTLVAAGKERYVNQTGTHGMSTGGSGDVLAGIIGGLLAGGLTPVRAAVLGVYLHGLAGEFAAAKKSRRGLLAGDILEGLTELFLIEENL